MTPKRSRGVAHHVALAKAAETPSFADAMSDANLRMAQDDPDLAVKLSAHIPELLAVASRESGGCLAQFTGPSSSTAGGPSSMSGASSRNEMSAESRAHYLWWVSTSRWFTHTTYCLCNALRLPAQQVLEYFASPAAAEQHVGWMEELAGRILVYTQQPGSRSKQPGQASFDSQVMAGRLPPWQGLACELLQAWNSVQMLHFQCLLAASPDAYRFNMDADSSGTDGHANDGGSKQGGPGGNSSSDGVTRTAACAATTTTTTSSSSKQTPLVSSVAGKGGTPWIWPTMITGTWSLSPVSLHTTTAWLRPNLVRLLHAWLRQAPLQEGMTVHNIRETVKGWALVQRAPSMHPAASQLGHCVPAEAAAAEQLGSERLAELQHVAWGYLATGSAALRQLLLPRLLRVRGVAALLHPTLQRCPSYHRSRSYGVGVLSALAKDMFYAVMPEVYERHLMGCEVWDLWPWQIQLLQEQEQLNTPSSSSSSSSSSSPPCQEGDAASTGSDGPATSSASAINATSITTDSEDDQEVTLSGPHSTYWPLLPHVAPPLPHVHNGSAGHVSCQLPPVSADQLHLALERVCLNVQLSTSYAGASLQLLVLLLLRADPALRLAFLQGPQGGLLLAALQLYGCGRTPLHEVVESAEPGLAPEGRMRWLCSEGVGLEGLEEVLFPIGTYSVLSAAAASALVLTWLLMHACKEDACGDSRDGISSSSIGGSNSRSSSSSSSEVNGSCAQDAAWTPGPVVRFGPVNESPGGLPLIQVPAAALQLLTGYTPHLQLAATLETLLLQGGDPSLLLGALADAYQQDPSRAPPPGSPMWLALASMAVGVRKRAVALVIPTADARKVCLEGTIRCLGCLLSLLRLAAVAQQQPGAGWGALVLGSAVQDPALACCAAALQSRDYIGTMLEMHYNLFSPLKQGSTRDMVAEQAQVGRDICKEMVRILEHQQGMQLSGAQVPAAPYNTAGATQVQDEPYAGGSSQQRTPSGLPGLLLEARDLLATLSSCWPGGQTAVAADPDMVNTAPLEAAPPAAAATSSRPSGSPTQAVAAGHGGSFSSPPSAPAAAAATAAVAQEGAPVVPNTAYTAACIVSHLSPTSPRAAPAAAPSVLPALAAGANNTDGSPDGTGVYLPVLYEALGVCEAAAACARLCSSRLQLLGCANLGCTTPPAPGLGGCEASLVVNCRGSVCGGCGVVRYCSAACAQQDWPGHRRVCRRLAAARALRMAAEQGDLKQ